MSKVEIDKEKLDKLWQVARFYDMRKGSIGGQAFTNFICLKCDKETSHPNTATPILCDDCTNQLRNEYKR